MLFMPSLDDAEDVVADVFAAMWTSRQRLMAKVSGGFESYLFGAIRNSTRQRHRNTIRRSTAGERFLLDEGRPPAMGTLPVSPDLETSAHELEAYVRSMIDAFPERTRAALLLRWDEQMGYDTIARILGLSAPATRQVIHRAIVVIRNRLKEVLG
jgi:RNA polymerase sigma-70 factor (ECF subfamily)